MALCGGQIRLPGGRAGPAKRVDDRDAEVAREIRRLIEAAMPAPGRVKRNRHGAGGAVEQRRPALTHERRQRPGERTARVVFQRVHDCAERTGVLANGAGAIDGGCASAAARADRERQGTLAPRRQRIAAAVADGRRDGNDAGPAGGADRTGGRSVEQLAAGRARRREQHGEDGVG